jgi:hypothetical protein
MMAQLLDRIKERIAEPTGGKTTNARTEILPLPATASEITKAESQLGFELPPLLKILYLEVANGGFGPGPCQGILGVPSRKAAGRLNVVKAFRNCSGRGWQWPVHLLPVVYAGGDVFFCIDCDHAKNRVIAFDGDLGGLEESDISEPRNEWPYPDSPLAVCFRTRAESFEEFLEMWLVDESQLYRWV